ncbi:alkaline phosphatase [Halioxenophilus aromaticivorans]|uniref:Alkaline phosphatase n=1 Tax=Halioxenophilus aromaticivorans TaxID=1306992 RepID=A0AAV3U4T6_9ALTE
MKFPISLLAIALASLMAAPLQAKDKPKNVILLVVDGMGPVYTSAYRYFADDPATKQVESTVIDELVVGTASTYPDADRGVITDSAAAATALSSGIKSYNGAIGVDRNHKPVQTMLEMAKAKGKRTGIAVTSQIVHATPAAFIAHNDSRKNYNAIADAYFDERIDGKFKADVMLGGGWDYFIRPDRNLVEEFTTEGYQYIDDMAQLGQLQQDQPVLGLFAKVGLPWALDMQGQPRLKALTQAAVSQLENRKGYFLLVEASQVDWAGHANDIAAAMAEMADFVDTLEWLKEYVESRKDTLLVVTADHSTGGLSMGAGNEYLWRPDMIKSLEASPDSLALLAMEQAPGQRAELIASALGLSPSQAQSAAIAQAEDSQALSAAIKLMIDEATHTGWTTHGHSGVDVPVLATGVGAEQFAGFQDNTDIAKKLINMINR